MNPVHPRGAGKSRLGAMIATAMAAAAAANTIPAPAPRATIKRRRARVENVAMQREIMAAAADKRARRALRPIPPTALVQP